MSRRLHLLLGVCVLLALVAIVLLLDRHQPSPATQDGHRLRVVASFSILGDLVRQVGGQRVAVTTLVGPEGDAHVYQPTPADARALGGSDLVIVNGLGFEGWLDRLVHASGYRGRIVVASDGVVPRRLDAANARASHAHSPLDPHAWQSVPNVERYVANIAAALSAADPQGASVYRANAARYTLQLHALHAQILRSIAALPPHQRTIVTSHDAFGYFAATYGLRFEAPQGVSTEAEASAHDVAALIAQIRHDGAAALFVEDITDPRLLQQIAHETSIRIGGTLYSDALSQPGGPASTYLDLMHHNLTALLQALDPARSSS
ncbi:metal ABC transporter substrate-binding protein [Xanthomonas maliensis]|uniref:metal ABC transporter substrate-binding protein n=1 Tax=Xanthomonas maliensis TaxID=1321368 RepID=UPI0003A897A7|nr:metal ABC transporter substrate-binding protein [Xanthomonas maliensis]KAB7770858.1 metal ABC transporter substrate-binding protein [Xanthomonas maliensis]